MATNKYAVLVEKGRRYYGAYGPDLSGCVAAGKTDKDVVEAIEEAIKMHIAALRRQGLPIPKRKWKPKS